MERTRDHRLRDLVRDGPPTSARWDGGEAAEGSGPHQLVSKNSRVQRWSGAGAAETATRSRRAKARPTIPALRFRCGRVASRTETGPLLATSEPAPTAIRCAAHSPAAQTMPMAGCP